MFVIVLLVLLHVLGYFDIGISQKEGMSSNTKKWSYIWVFIGISVIGYLYAGIMLGPLFGIGSKRVPITDRQWKFAN
jgi:hypothetical protein